MCSRKKEHYEVGDVVCDMDDFFKYLPDNLEVIQHIKLATETTGVEYDADKIVRLLVPNYLAHKHGNKFLTIVGSTPLGDKYIAIYNYDGHTFGMVSLGMK